MWAFLKHLHHKCPKIFVNCGQFWNEEGNELTVLKKNKYMKIPRVQQKDVSGIVFSSAAPGRRISVFFTEMDSH